MDVLIHVRARTGSMCEVEDSDEGRQLSNVIAGTAELSLRYCIIR
jgi:hypothetical protein